MQLSKISAVILVKNAQRTLLECLNSLRDFGEIVLLDNESSDDTIKIAQEFNKKYQKLRIYHSAFIGFGALKNLAIRYAKNEWILSIDSDEVLEISCLKELENLELQKEDIVSLPRKNCYKKEWIKACGWYPDYVYRVFHKDFTHFNDNVVHESLIITKEARIKKLHNGLRHYAYESIYGLLEKLQRYSNLWAQQNLHKKSSMSKSIVRSVWKFLRDYFFKKGFLYGYKGFVISFCNALGVFFKYAKLYELNRKTPTCSLVITTYNSPKFLALVLESVKRLEYLPDEVLIADDGSKEESAKLIKEYQKNFPCPLFHIWQEDKGFRAAAIRNKAVEAAHCEYIIIIDGDMILQANFIKDHLNFAKRKVYLQGSRIILDKSQTQNLLNGGGQIENLPKAFKARRCALLSKLYFQNSKITASFFKKKELIKGSKSCNMSCFKEDWQNIQGFNENFKAWGREDSEFVARFLFNGGEFRRVKFKAIAYHLYHKENDKTNLSQNHELYLKTIKNKTIYWKTDENSFNSE